MTRARLPGVLNSGGCRWDWLEATTGPVMLFHAVQAYKAVYPKAPGLNILKPGLIYPIDWRRTVWGPNDGPGAEYFRLQKKYSINERFLLVLVQGASAVVSYACSWRMAAFQPTCFMGCVSGCSAEGWHVGRGLLHGKQA